MKSVYKKILPFILSAEILILSIFSCSISVYAADFMPTDIVAAVEYGIEYNDWEPFYRFLYESSSPLLYLVSQMGAVATVDFQKWVDNNKKLESMIDIVPAKMEDDKIVFTKEFMAQLKALLDEYYKTEQTKEENGGFYLMPTINYEDVSMEIFNNSYKYYTFRNIVREKGILSVRIRWNDFVWFNDPCSDPDHPILFVADASSLANYLDNPEARVGVTYFCAYDWKKERFPYMYFKDTEKIFYSCSEAVQYNTGDSGYTNGSGLNKFDNYNYTLYSTTGERVRVFVSEYAAKNYSVGSRKIYFSENYYNYVPEDLTVSIDDLQKSVDDLQKIIDELLKKISDQTSEKEIEELLRQILEELRKNPGTGSGSGGGDVTVDVDLSTTNNWLSKIYNRLGEILNKMSSSVENAEQTALDGIQSRLDEISETLKKIKNWTIADTVIDAADAVADWLDLVRDLLKDAEAGAGAVVSSLSSALGNSAGILSSKFPFCVPWDIFAIVSFLRAEPEAPHFKLPIILERYGIESYIEIDMEPFQVVSDISRTMLALLYAYGLVMLTGKVIDIGKEVP